MMKKIIWTAILIVIIETVYWNNMIPKDQVLAVNLYQKRVLVISPHQDDEIIACAGVIKRYVDRGADIRVLYLTNGDYYNRSQERMLESISALKLLGLKKDKIIYLGYGDWSLLGLYNNRDFPDTVVPTKFHSWTTSLPDIGIYSYHYSQYGSEASYTRRNITADIYNVLLDFQPEEIYMPAQLEGHQDHSGGAFFTIEAILKIQQLIFYQPTTFEYMIYSGNADQGLWMPELLCDPTKPVTNENLNIDDYIPYPWFKRVSVAAPSQMITPFTSVGLAQLPVKPSDNLKYNAIHKFVSQFEWTFGLYERFVRSNEVFWKRKIASLSYNAQVETSSEDAAKNQFGRNVIDGIFVGELKAPFDGWNRYFQGLEWATDGSTPGGWIQLSWRKPVTANQIKLYDRPNFRDNILSGELQFSDGTILTVGKLNPNGAATTINFPIMTFDWVKFTMEGFEGPQPGLSEFEVYDTTENIGIKARVTASGQNTHQLATKAIDGIVDGAPKDSSKEWAVEDQTIGAWIQLDWPQEYIITEVILHDRVNLENQVKAGKIIFHDGSYLEVDSLPDDGAGLIVPISFVATNSLRFVLTDFRGNSAGLAELEVYGYPRELNNDYYNIAPGARVTVSSERKKYSRLKAVDGVRSGYPCDNGCEWISNRQLTGAWLQLNWERYYYINRVVLYDRPNPEDHILAGKLLFDDNSFLAVSSLPNDGTGYPVDIPEGKNIKSLRFEITQAVGHNAGLSEIEVRGCPGRKINILKLSPIITSTPARTGRDANCFDGREETFYESQEPVDFLENQGPCFIQLVFQKRVSVSRIRALIGAAGHYDDKYDWWVEAADTIDDLNMKNGSYLKVGDTRYDVGGYWDQISYPSATVNKKIWKFWIVKKAEDGYSLISELELWSE